MPLNSFTRHWGLWLKDRVRHLLTVGRRQHRGQVQGQGQIYVQGQGQIQGQGQGLERVLAMPMVMTMVMASFFCIQCSISLENPEAEANKKLEKVIPATWQDLEGRWIGDSTFTVEDTRATKLGPSIFNMEIFRDSSLIVEDVQNLIFRGKVKARLRLSGDSLYVHPIGANATLLADTFKVKVRFLGNRLELEHLTHQRFSFFHKRKFPDSSTQASILQDSLWTLQGRRMSLDSTEVELLNKDFSYLKFSGENMIRDWHRDGIYNSDSGVLDKKGRMWTWITSRERRDFLVDLMDKDTLRIWPSLGGKTDSGFYFYTHQGKKHPLDLDMRPYLNHLRTDSIKGAGPTIITHFGRYFDLVLSQDHGVQTQTNMPGLPHFKSWTLDSGKIRLIDPAHKSVVFTLDSIGGNGERLTNFVKLSTDSGAHFKSKTTFFQTKVQGTRFVNFPLERFDQADFAQIKIGNDTLNYFFKANFLKGSPDQYEIQHIDSTDTSWLIFKMPITQTTFSSSQTGFKLTLEGRTSEYGKFTCQGLASNPLVLRLVPSSDPSTSAGLIQGACSILKSDIAPVDSTLTLNGSFRMKRKTNSALQSQLWLP